LESPLRKSQNSKGKGLKMRAIAAQRRNSKGKENQEKRGQGYVMANTRGRRLERSVTQTLTTRERQGEKTRGGLAEEIFALHSIKPSERGGPWGGCVRERILVTIQWKSWIKKTVYIYSHDSLIQKTKNHRGR